jgi:predicted phosphodiesterase
MSQVQKLVDELEGKYKVSVQEFLQAYLENLSTEEMASKLGVTDWSIRVYSATLNLRLPKKYRGSDYALYLSRFSESAEVLITAELSEAQQDLEYLSKSLIAKEGQLLRTKSELAKYRRAVKPNIELEDFMSVVEASTAGIKPLDFTKGKITAKTTSYKEHTQFILLSDLHFEETVSSKDIGKSNSYDWDIATVRLGRVFSESMNAYRGEENCVVMLGGDMLDGLVHDSLETANKPLGEAVADLAVLISQYLLSLGTIYGNVHVPCVSGNHERLTDHKKSHNQGFGFAYLLYQMIKSLVASNKSIKVHIATCGFHTFTIGNSTIGLFHGDYNRSVGEMKYFKVKEAFTQATGDTPDIIFCGHTHNFKVEDMPRGGKYITNGSLIGTNSYATTNGFTGLDWGQVIGSFLPSGTLENLRLVSNS